MMAIPTDSLLIAQMREAMRETRVMIPRSESFAELLHREQHDSVHRYTIFQEHCHRCGEHKTMPQAVRCPDVCCPKVDKAYTKLVGTGSYCSGCGMNGSRSLGQETCYHCGQQKTFLYLEESK